MSEYCSFGVGCFHFGTALSPGSKFDGKRYLASLEAAFRNITCVEEFSIAGEKDVRDIEGEVPAEVVPLGDGPNYYPGWHEMGIELLLHIPMRVQAELVSTHRVRTFTERFRVHLHQEYDSPLAFVELIDPGEIPSPSDAVQIVRELFTSEFKKISGSEIRFDCIGPSPFHADFYIKLEMPDEFDEGFEVEMVRERRVGYDAVTFYADPAAFDDLEEARAAVFERAAREADVFYEIMQVRAEEMREWEQVETAVDQLLSSESDLGFRHRLLRLFKTRQLVANAYRVIVEYEGSVVQNEDECQRKLAGLYTLDADRWFEESVQQAMKERYKRPIAQRMQLVSFIENRRIHRGQNFVVLIAAILGGAIGAVLTLIVEGKAVSH